MDPVRLGRQVRALRRRKGWRQADLARAAAISRATVSRLELGGGDALTLRSIEDISRALGARVQVLLSWNGEGLDRLLDADHAGLVERVTRELAAWDWDVAVEVSFNVAGERGSIDVLAFHPRAMVALIVEVKSVVPDLQAMLVTLDRKARLGRSVARDRGWSAHAVGRVLVIGDTRTARRRVEQHAAVFEAAFPARSVAVRQWLRQPDAAHALSGIWFLSDATTTSARHRVARRRAGPRA